MEVKATSSLLGTEIELKEYEDGMYVIPHDALEGIVMKNSARFGVSYKAVSVSANHNVVECKIEDTVTGIEITKVGESIDKTLATPIARNYPTLMAYQRAFDRAAIAILMIDGKKVYSSLELDTSQLREPGSDAVEEDAPIPLPDEVEEELPAEIDALPLAEAADESASPVDAPATDKAADQAEIKPDQFPVELEGETVDLKKDDTPALPAPEANTAKPRRRKKDVAPPFGDDEVMLIGPCEGMTFGVVKKSKDAKTGFMALVRAIKDHPDLVYEDEKRQTQLDVMRRTIAALEEK